MGKKKAKSKKIRPEVLKGFRDYEPSEEIARQRMISVFREVFESFGFSPLQTPALEKIEILKGADYGSDNLETIFNFIGPEKVDMALRFEFTASLARYVAGNPELPLPFRRYQFGPVWRVDKPGLGRFREFMQFDIDSVGTTSMLADAEIMAAIAKSFETMGLDYCIRYSNRKILNGVAKYIGIPDDVAPDVFRVIDKLGKQGKDAVEKELGPGRIDKSGDKISGLNLPKTQIAPIMWFLSLTTDTEIDILEKIRNWLSFTQVGKEYIETGKRLGSKEAAERIKSGEISFPNRDENLITAGIKEAEEGICELEQIREFLKSFNVPEDKTQVDVTIVRGLGYYTGPVFETYLNDIPEVGSVFAGGRMMGWWKDFWANGFRPPEPAAGPDRLLAALMSRDLVESRTTISDVLVTAMDPDKMPEYIKILNQIRGEGIPAEIFLGETKNLTKQLKYGDKVGVPVAVILGSDEFENNQVTVKNLVAGRVQAQEVADREEWLKAENIQETINREKLIPYLRDLLQKIKSY